MNPNQLRSLEEAAFAIESQFGPSREQWELTAPKFTRAGVQLTVRGALETTMHFGAVHVDCETGGVRFVDEDHKDGANVEVLKVQLPAPWLERLRELAAR
jgi:hypothetical protein